MIVARVRVSGAQARADDTKPVTAGMVGAQLQLEYTDPVWDGLRKTVVFYGAVVKDIITDATLVTIPAEVIARPNARLTVGVYGVDADGSVVIPTLLADIGTVRVGVKPSGDTTTNHILPVWAQILNMIGDLKSLDTTAKDNLVSAINEVLSNCGTDEDDVQRILKAYLAANPPTVKETDPTVPTWAKQPQKPTYTAAEVGALPNTYTPPIATETTLGGVKAAAATEDMTQPVGITADGKLVTAPSPDSGGNADQSSGGLSTEASALLITILRNGVYSTDQSANITVLETALKESGSSSGGGSGGDDSGGSDDGGDTGSDSGGGESGGGDTTANITKTDSTLVIISGVTVTKTNSTLALT